MPLWKNKFLDAECHEYFVSKQVDLMKYLESCELQLKDNDPNDS